MATLQTIKPELDKVAEKFSGIMGYTIVDETTGDCIGLNENRIFPTASTCKVWVLAYLLHLVDEGKLSLDDEVELNEGNMRGGSGVLKVFQLGLKMKLIDAATLMVVVSDNSATNICIDAVGGVDKVNEYVRSLGITDSVLKVRIEFELIINNTDLAETTPAQMVRFLRMVREGKVLSPEMTEVWMDILSKQQCLGQFPRYMDYSPYAAEFRQPKNVSVYSKTGFMVQARIDVGYIERNGKWVTYAVFSDESNDTSFDVDQEGEIASGKIGKMVYDVVLS